MGNLYLSNLSGVRKIEEASGIISCTAGITHVVIVSVTMSHKSCVPLMVGGATNTGAGGDGGPPTSAMFALTVGLDYAGGQVYVTDYSNYVVRKLGAPYPTAAPVTAMPSVIPSAEPTLTFAPSMTPSTIVPSAVPSATPSKDPSLVPSIAPTLLPSEVPSIVPSATPSAMPTLTLAPSQAPSPRPSVEPSVTSTAATGSTLSTSTKADHHKVQELSTGGIVGIIVGGLVLLCLLFSCLYFVWCGKGRRKNRSNDVKVVPINTNEDV